MSVDTKTAENQRRFRAANEQIDDARAELGFTGDRVPFLCECPDLGCTEVIPLTPDEYERARQDDDLFLLIPGHVPAGEDVVVRTDGYVVTRKGEER